jgi:hypothetical protein
MLCDVNYDVRGSSYIFLGFQYFWPFVFGMLQNIFQTTILATEHTQTYVRDVWFYVMCMHIREMGVNLSLLKCQTFTFIGLDLRKTYSMCVFHFCYQVLLTKDTEWQIWIASSQNILKNKLKYFWVLFVLILSKNSGKYIYRVIWTFKSPNFRVFCGVRTELLSTNMWPRQSKFLSVQTNKLSFQITQFVITPIFGVPHFKTLLQIMSGDTQ